MLAILALCSATAQAADGVRWFTLESAGNRTGYVRLERTDEPGGGTRVSEQVVLVLRQLDQTARVERHVTLRRDSAGAPREFDYALDSGTVHENWHGKFAGNTLVLTPASGPAQRIELPDDTRFTPDRSELLADLRQTPDAAATLTVFDPARRSAGPLRVRRIDDATGDAATWMHLRSGGGAAGGGEDLWFDATGALMRLDAHVLGATLRWVPCSSDCDADIATPMDALRSLVVRSPVAIPAEFKHRTLRYQVSRADGATPQLAATPEQAVSYDGAHAVITVCDDCGAAETPAADELARYTAANAWVRSDAPEIRTLALNSAPRGARTDYRMQKLVEVVQRRMTGSIDLLGYADAVTALRSGAGDCTEFAVLLGALARAQGIPTRLVAGLAYSDNFGGHREVFGPHMWVQAWDGTRWKSYDAALGEFDATHLALAVGSGAPEDFERLLAQIPQLRIEKAGAVKAP